jgi:hypothetical protein
MKPAYKKAPAPLSAAANAGKDTARLLVVKISLRISRISRLKILADLCVLGG